MNKSFGKIRLEDKYEVTDGRILIDGVQAITRLPILQRGLDKLAGLKTGGFVSGYRGSPLGRLDDALLREGVRLAASNIIFQPGVNEDLAATAVWGTQQIDAIPEPTVDGVFGLWYGKGPGVDRCGDVFKHANFAGTNKNGGVLVVAGDDHPGKSSTIAHHSEPALAASLIPCLYPSSVSEFFEYGLKGWALSRHSGLWVGFKTVNETVEQTATIDIDLSNFGIIRPELPPGSPNLNYMPGYVPPEQAEILVRRHRLPAAMDFIRANQLDRVVIEGGRRLGIITAGKAYQDVREALRLLDIDERKARQLGLSVYKLGCVWPVEPEGLRAFAEGQSELLVVEEKGAFIERQVAAILINTPDHPKIVGKIGLDGEMLIPSDIQLMPHVICRVIVDRLEKLGGAGEELKARIALLAGPEIERSSRKQLRSPFFCSGCPHNRSTRVPEGSLAMAGIGCHAMAVYNRSDTLPPTHMGGEGLNWTGLSHFTETPHIFQNLGDGTYYHSGLLAIRGAVASRANITFKILYNDVVAMTGGQQFDGPLSVEAIARQVLAEGVVRCVIITDNLATYKSVRDLPRGVDVFDRAEFDRIQLELRQTTGTTVLIYEQTCANERRRRRKRGLIEDPPKRLFINPAVCEGCGDCSAQSTCVSITPKQTSWGQKRAIDQASCNKDYSCAEGFCPSFVTVLGARLAQSSSTNRKLTSNIAAPDRVSLEGGDYRVMITGIGGGGVITVGAVLAMAAHIDGLASQVYDMTGLSQKNGAVYSHLQFARSPNQLTAARVGQGRADLVIAFDLLAARSGDAENVYSPRRTNVLANADVVPTSAFQFGKEAGVSASTARTELERWCRQAEFIDARPLALKHCGDPLMANMLLVGYAAQKGLLPVSVHAITEAIKLNGVAVEANLEAFELGRQCAADLGLTDIVDPVTQHLSSPEASFEELVAARADFLSQYQGHKLAHRYRSFVERVRVVELETVGENSLALAVAKSYAKLLAYKDEYEVARLYTDNAFQEELSGTFAEWSELRLNLAPPLLAKRDPVTNLPRKAEFGPWIFPILRMMAKFRFLRGTIFDPFGYTNERRCERQLIVEYERLIEESLISLNRAKHGLVVTLATLPESIRGFGYVKEKAIRTYRQRQTELLSSIKAQASDATVENVDA